MSAQPNANDLNLVFALTPLSTQLGQGNYTNATLTIETEDGQTHERTY
jgi:hypothetical protein